MTIQQPKAGRQPVNSIAWEIPLDWGADWTHDHDMVRSDEAGSISFILYDWVTPPRAILLKRTTIKGAVEITKIPVPKELFAEACDEDSRSPGGTVHRLNANAKLIDWLCEQIDGACLLPAVFH